MIDRPDGYCGKDSPSGSASAGEPVSVTGVELHTTYDLFIKKHIYVIGTVSNKKFYLDIGSPEVLACAPWQAPAPGCVAR
jgi:hypothetical protein